MEQFLDPKVHELVCVKYFTAPPNDAGKKIRQSALFKANKFLNGSKIEFIQGKYYSKNIKCRATCKQPFTIYEEKRTDVNISVEIMGDCAFDKTDLIILISADSDLMPTIEYIKTNFSKKRLKVFFPPCRKSSDIFNAIKPNIVYLENNKLKFDKAIMPHTVTDGYSSVTIPTQWIVI